MVLVVVLDVVLAMDNVGIFVVVNNSSSSSSRT
jgi:predicted tellurium resistance membrane protein TerC